MQFHFIYIWFLLYCSSRFWVTFCNNMNDETFSGEWDGLLNNSIKESPRIKNSVNWFVLPNWLTNTIRSNIIRTLFLKGRFYSERMESFFLYVINDYQHTRFPILKISMYFVYFETFSPSKSGIRMRCTKIQWNVLSVHNFNSKMSKNLWI